MRPTFHWHCPDRVPDPGNPPAAFSWRLDLPKTEFHQGEWIETDFVLTNNSNESQTWWKQWLHHGGVVRDGVVIGSGPGGLAEPLGFESRTLLPHTSVQIPNRFGSYARPMPYEYRPENTCYYYDEPIRPLPPGTYQVGDWIPVGWDRGDPDNNGDWTGWAIGWTTITIVP